MKVQQQIAEAYKDSQDAVQEDNRLRELEFDIAIKRKAAHLKRLEADERLWIIQHKAASYNAKGLEI
jgi:hypothetical protein